MATRFKDDVHELRSERLVVLVSPTEKRAIEARARNANLSLSDFVRVTAQNDDVPTEAEREALSQILAELADLNARTDATLARLDAVDSRATAFDEATFKARLESEWTKDGEPDWPLIRAAFNRSGFNI